MLLCSFLKIKKKFKPNSNNGIVENTDLLEEILLDNFSTKLNPKEKSFLITENQ